MRKFFASATAALLAALGTVTQAASSIPLDYYSSLNGKKGSELKTAIHNLVSNNVKMLGYGSGNQNTWWGFYVTDYEMDGSQRLVVDRYSNNVWYFGSRGASVSGMNIEHSFPKSWWGGTQNNAYKDLFNLMPCEKNINTSKSNYGMGVVTNVKTDNGCTKVGTGADGTNLWEPADKWKGDFARGYMYMATAYQDFTWTGEGLNSLQQGAYPTLQKWASDLYIKWAKADPVDDREITRNSAVQDIQGNRNPYVDFPNLMEYVWGDSTTFAFNVKTTVKAGDYIAPVDPVDPPVGPVDPSTDKGTIDNPYTVAEALAACTATESAEVYVRGYVTSVKSWNSKYPNIDYYLGDTADATETIMVFRGRWIDNADITAENQPEVGAKVLIKGKLYIYNGTTKEVTSSSIIEYTAPGTEPEPEPDPDPDPVVPAEGSATFNFADPTTLTPSYSLEGAVADSSNQKHNVNGVVFTADGISLTSSGTGTESRLYYQNASKAWTYRVYTNSTVTFSCGAKQAMTSIVFTTQTTKYGQTLGGFTFTPGSYDSATKTLTLPEGTTSYSFDVTGTVGFTGITVNYVSSDTDGVEDVVADSPSDGEDAWYSLQGVRVHNPVPGLYIRVRGGKASKVLIR